MSIPFKFSRDMIPPAISNQGMLERIKNCLHQGNPQKAFELSLRFTGEEARNARGICLLRLGEFRRATIIYRNLIFEPGRRWACPVTMVHKLNFATSLLLAGNTAGCVGILNYISHPEHPVALRLRACIRRWEDQLSSWQRLHWMCGQMDAEHRDVPIDFLPGVFEDGQIWELPSAVETVTAVMPPTLSP